ncbi:MAG: hypothetical protein ABI568_13990, partial [Pseudarthrobacter sp.]
GCRAESLSAPSAVAPHPRRPDSPPPSEEASKVVLDIAFIGVNGIDPVVGPTNTGEGEASVNALLASRARVSYVLADSSKVGVRAFATMDGYEFSRLITDAGISAEDKAAFEANGTEVIVAPQEQR